MGSVSDPPRSNPPWLLLVAHFSFYFDELLWDSVLLFIPPDLRASSAYGLTETDREKDRCSSSGVLSASCSSNLVPSSGPVMWKKSVRLTRERSGGRFTARERVLGFSII